MTNLTKMNKFVRISHSRRGVFIEKSINRLIVSVTITTLLFFISIPLWNYSVAKRSAILASSYGDLAISVNIGTFDSLVAIEDYRAFDYIKPTTISFRNRNGFKKEFDLLLLVSKDSTIDYKDLKVSIGEKIYHVKSLEMLEDSDNYYFIINSYSLEAYSEDSLEARIWLDENIQGNINEKTLTTNFTTR